LSENNKDMKIKNYPSEMGIWIVCWSCINQILIKIFKIYYINFKIL
jgi:hypothetical protein